MSVLLAQVLRYFARPWLDTSSASAPIPARPAGKQALGELRALLVLADEDPAAACRHGILRVLRDAGHQRDKAAHALGISRRSLYNAMSQLGLHEEADRQAGGKPPGPPRKPSHVSDNY